MPTPPKLEDGVQATIDVLIEINLRIEEDHRPTFINAHLSPEEQMHYYEFLKENQDVFAWNYSKMLVLDPNVAVHHFSIDPSQWPIKQHPRKPRHDITDQIEEVDKLCNARFI